MFEIKSDSMPRNVMTKQLDKSMSHSQVDDYGCLILSPLSDVQFNGDGHT